MASRQRVYKWLVLGVLFLAAWIYLVPATIILFPYMLAEPGRLRDFGDVPMWWSLGEWVRTLWVFGRRAKGVDVPSGARWVAAGIVLGGSLAGLLFGLWFVPASVGDRRAGWRAAAIGTGVIVIASHWLGRWWLRRNSPVR
jgi:hypothetical protein